MKINYERDERRQTTHVRLEIDDRDFEIAARQVPNHDLSAPGASRRFLRSFIMDGVDFAFADLLRQFKKAQVGAL